jgi:2-hydroxy-3-keto-5-methylthiopentenyl-1-phosphate phosphatase
VVIGDGRSDFCMAAGADYVIAKGTLAGHCRSLGWPHVTLTDFDDVTAHLSGWLATAGRAPAKAARANAQALPRLET